MKKLFGTLFIIILYPINPVLTNDEIIKVYYSGFSFSNTYESNTAYAIYTSSLIKKAEKKTFEKIDSFKVMQRAAKACSNYIIKNYSSKKLFRFNFLKHFC